MSKQEITDKITEQFNLYHIPYSEGGESDIVIDNELLNVSWSMGKKEIAYKSYILICEKERTVFMWEMSKEKSAGMSFASRHESSFQSGGTLFRKIKGTAYGPEGKVLQYDIDLGIIPKTVKDAAVKCGWKFKTVLKKEKAMY
jgi:predicted transcriptional regulator of viral defense system